MAGKGLPTLTFLKEVFVMSPPASRLATASKFEALVSQYSQAFGARRESANSTYDASTSPRTEGKREVGKFNKKVS